MTGDVSEKLAIAAVKYALLKSAVGPDIAFSFEESISLHGNSGPYVQYTYARTRSVLAKAARKTEKSLSRINLDSEEQDVLRKLIHFPEVVGHAAERFAPSDICTYLFELAQAFNLFYQKAPILKSGEREALRLALTDATGIVLQNGLNLLGIKTVEKM